jgi:outer membrane lipoprotein carrier protein
MRLLYTSILAVLFFAQHLALAQYDPKALQVLDAMSNKYQNIGAYQANFSYTLINEQEGISDRFDGNLLVMGDKFRLIMAGQEIFCDGKTVWTYIEEINEVNIDHYDANEMEMSPSKIYNAYKKGYKFLFIDEKTQSGQIFQTIDLVPEDTGSPFFKVRLSIGKKDFNLHFWEIFDKNGNRYQYQVKSFQESASVNNTDFEFDVKKYPGVEVIDLR